MDVQQSEDGANSLDERKGCRNDHEEHCRNSYPVLQHGMLEGRFVVGCRVNTMC